MRTCVVRSCPSLFYVARPRPNNVFSSFRFTRRICSFALIALPALLFVLLCSGKVEASCGDYLMRLGAHDHAATDSMPEPKSDGDAPPCDGPGCGQAPASPVPGGTGLAAPERDVNNIPAMLGQPVSLSDAMEHLWSNSPDHMAVGRFSDRILRPPKID